MTGSQTDRLTGLKSGLAVKAPCRVATTANITTFSGLQTVDGVTLVAGDRVLVKSQSDTTENGIYYVNTSSPYTWELDSDFDGARDATKGTTVRVTDGTANAGTWWELTSANPVRPGTDAITWTQVTIPLSSIATYLTGTSTTSLAVGTGAKVFTTQANLAWTAGTRLRVASDDSTKIMDGEITTYSGTTLTLDIDYTEGSGTHADWNISIVGARGATGADGTVDITSQTAVTDPAIDDLLLLSDTSAGTNRKITTANFMKVINDLTAETAVDSADEVPIYDSSGSTADKTTVANLFKAVTTLTDTAIVSGDELLFCDVSDSNNAKKGNVSDIVALATAGASSGWVPIKTTTAANDATIDFVNGVGGVVFDSTYKAYAVVINYMRPATDGALAYFRTTSNAGSSFDSGVSDYAYAWGQQRATPSTNSDGDTTAAFIPLCAGTGISNNSTQGASGVIYIFNPSLSTKNTQIIDDFVVGYAPSGGVLRVFGAGCRVATADVDGFRIYMDSGNITDGVFTLYGLKDA